MRSTNISSFANQVREHRSSKSTTTLLSRWQLRRWSHQRGHGGALCMIWPSASAMLGWFRNWWRFSWSLMMLRSRPAIQRSKTSVRQTWALLTCKKGWWSRKKWIQCWWVKFFVRNCFTSNLSTSRCGYLTNTIRLFSTFWMRRIRNTSTRPYGRRI